MEHQHKPTSFRYLTTLCKDHFGINTKIVYITFKNLTSSHVLEIGIMLFEYLQLLSQAFLINYDFRGGYLNKDDNLLVDATTFIARMLNPGTWLNLNEHIGITVTLITVGLIQAILKCLIFLYIIATGYLNVKGQPWAIDLWTTVFKIQDRVLYFLSTSLWVSIILSTLQDDLDTLKVSKTAIMMVCASLIVMEIVFSLFIQLGCCFILPRKSFLSTRDNKIEVITLTQKFMVQVLQIILIQKSSMTEWILVSLNFAFSFTRLVYFFRTLPHYHLKALKFKGMFIASVMSLHLVFFLEIILRNTGYQTETNFIVVTWLISLFIVTRSSSGYMERTILRLITNKGEFSPELQAHKIFFVKDLRKLKGALNKLADKSTYSYLVNSAINTNIQNDFHLDSSDLATINELDLFSKKSSHQIFLRHLENLALKFPGNGLIKLYIAYMYAKKLQQYSRAMRIIKSLQRTHPYKYGLNAYLLILNMQDSLKPKYKNKDTEIDLSSFVKSKSHFAQLKVQMVDQGKMMTHLYHEILKERPDLERVFTLSQTINQHRSMIERKSKLFFNLSPDYYMEPLLVFAEYNQLLNFSISQCELYYKKYDQKIKRYDKYLKQDKLVQENLYEPDNVFIICSYEKISQAGKIVFCTRNIGQHFGGDPSLYLGTCFADVAIPCQIPLFRALHKDIAETGDCSKVGSTFRSFTYHKDGYMLELEFYVSVHPYLTQGFYICIIGRPTLPTSKEYLWLLENGDIDAATKDFSERFGLLGADRVLNGEHKRLNAKLISPDLARINEAYNIVAKNGPDQKKEEQTQEDKSVGEGSGIKMTYEEAMDLYNNYSSKEGDIVVKPIKSKGGQKYASSELDNYRYKCQVVNVNFGIMLRLVILESCNSDNNKGEFEKLLSGLEKNSESTEKIVEANEKPSVQQSGEQIENLNSEDFDFIDEEEPGETNSKYLGAVTQPYSPQSPQLAFSVRESLLTSAQADVAGTSEHQYMAPLKNRKQVISPQLRKLQDKRLVSRSQETKYQSYQSHEDHNHMEDSEDKNNKKPKSRKLKEVRMSKGEQAVRNAFEAALKIKYYPNKLKLVYVLFYALLVSIFVLMMVFKNNIEEVIGSFTAIKDIINNIETKDFNLAFIQLVSLNLLRLTTNFNDILLDSETVSKAEKDRQDIRNRLIKISELNAKLLQNVDYIKIKSLENLFRKDVRVFDSYYHDPEQIYTTLDNFQATDRLVEVGLKGAAKMQTNITNGRDEILFLLRNTGNDVLQKNEAVSDASMAFFDIKKQDTDNLTLFSLGASLLVNFVKIMIFLVVIWKQYLEDKSIMLALTKLNPRELHGVLGRMTAFTEAIENDQQLEQQESSSKNKNGMDKYTVVGREAKKESSIKPKLKQKQKRYFFYTMNLLFMIMILVASLNFMFFYTSNSTTSFQEKQNQLYFIQRLKSNAFLTLVTLQEMIVENATTLNHNTPISKQITKSIKGLSTLRNQVSSVFIKDDLTPDSGIESVLFIDGCSVLEEPTKTLCQNQKSTLGETNLLSLLNQLESLLVEKVDLFKTSDRSQSSLAKLVLERSDPGFSILFWIDIECETIIYNINQQYSEDMINAKDQMDFTFWMFCGYMAVYSILIWVFFLRNFIRINNKLKRVLQNFPATLILSNLTLKLFVIKTSKEALDHVKNDM